MTVDISDIDPFSWTDLAELRKRCEADAVRKGLSGVHLFLHGQELFSDALSRFPTYKERQLAWKENQSRKITKDPLREALEAIRDGHNDPRMLAVEVLELVERKEGKT